MRRFSLLVNVFFDKVARIWARMVFWFRVVKPARASFIAVVLFGLLFLEVPQGMDLLRRLGAERASPAGWSVDWIRVTLLYVTLFIFGLASWAWARFLLNCRFPGVPQRDLIWARFSLRRIVRRALGLAPPLIMAAAFGWLCWRSRQPRAPTGHHPDVYYGFFALGCVGVAVLLFVYFEVWMRRTDANRHFRDLAEIRTDAIAWLAVRATLAASLLAFVGFTCWPVTLGAAFGSAAILMLALSCWLGVGSILVYYGSHYRVPVMALTLLLAFVAGPFNDNHHVRTLAKTASQPVAGESVSAALDRWLALVEKKYPLPPNTSVKARKRPLFLVAAAGGGIRAGYWPAIILGALEDASGEARRASFAEHTFAVSAVSGGALGTAVFTSLVAHGPNGIPYCTRAQGLLQDDFLAPDLAKMGFADLLQRFLPCKIDAWDRGRSLEDAWADAWNHAEPAVTPNPFDHSVDELYQVAADRGVWLPAIVFNGTSVETGKRIITSNLAVTSRSHLQHKETEGDFLDVIPAADKLKDVPIRVSTAVHQSARFTYFSPAGSFDDRTRIVDGGYFEGSGAATLLDLLEAVERKIKSDGSEGTGWKFVQPVLILIDNAPISYASLRNGRPSIADDAAAHQSLSGNDTSAAKRQFFSETLSPLDALLQAWNAQSILAFSRAQDFARSDPAKPAMTPAPDAARAGAEEPTKEPEKVFEFHLYKRSIDLPLGWTLSGPAAEEMNQQLIDTKMDNNPEILCQIVDWLPPR